MLKKLLLLVIVCSIFLVSPVFALTDLTNCTDLMAIDTNDDYQMTGDIDCAGYNFVAISKLNRTIDGQGYSINNLYINSSTDGECAMITDGRTGSEFINVNFDNATLHCYNDAWYNAIIFSEHHGLLENVTITNSVLNSYDGMPVTSLIASAESSGTYPIIRNAHFDGIINIHDGGGAEHIGGLVAYGDCEIYDSSSSGEINCLEQDSCAYVGGISGLSESGDGYFDNVSSTMDLNMHFSVGAVGGLFGAVQDVTIINSHYIGEINGGWEVGGIAGEVYGDDVVQTYIDNVYVIANITSTEVGEVQYIGGFVSNFERGNVINNSYFRGTLNGTNTIGGLVAKGMGGIHNSYVEADIYCSDTDCGGIAGEVSQYSLSGREFNNNYFIGTITGTTNVGGIVGNLQDSYSLDVVLNNVRVINSTIVGDTEVGGLVGYMGIGNITNSYAIADITANDDLGGLVGVTNWADTETILISNSYYDGTLTGAGGLVGGIIGYSYNTETYVDSSYSSGEIIAVGGNAGGIASTTAGGEITNSYSSMDITASTDTGGLVGYLENTLIDTSYSTGFINVSNENAGGLVGISNGGTINNSYATGNVVSGTKDVGGLVGEMSNSAVIENSYSTGTVDGSSNYGGLLGTLTSGTCTSSYWDTETSSEPSSACGDGKTTVEMQTLGTFTDWDAVDCETGYTFVMKDYPCLFDVDVSCSCQQVIDESNYSIVDGYLIADDGASELGENITITYLYQQSIQSASGQVITETTSAIAGTTSWFSIFIVITSMVVLIILTVIIITAIKGSGLMSEGGA